MYKYISIVIVLVFALTSISNAQLKIGYMNPQDALNEMPERDSVEQALNQFIAQKRGELENKTAEFQQELTNYQNNQSSMSESEQAEEEQRLTALDQELQEFQQSIQVQVQQKRAELLQPLLARVDRAIASVSEELDLDFVINESTSTNSQIVFFANDNAPNITERVIEKLNLN